MLVELLREIVLVEPEPWRACLLVAAAVLVALALLFLGLAGLPFLIFWYRTPGALEALRVNHRIPRSAVHIHEALHSLSSIAIYAVLTIPLVFLARHGYGQIQLTDALPWWRHGLSLAAFIVVHDAYFYWTHRLLHLPRFARFHAAHHRSVAPSSLAIFAFHPIEAVVQYGVVYVFFFCVPAPIHTYVAWAIIQAAASANGHLGFDVLPSSHLRLPLLKHVLGATHHGLHHQGGRRNFGLFFTFWDRACGTEDARYRAMRRPLAEPSARAGRPADTLAETPSL